MADLVAAGYLTRTRTGRRNLYSVNTESLFRHSAQEGLRVGAFLELLTQRAEARTLYQTEHHGDREAGMSDNGAGGRKFVTKESPRNVPDTVARLVELLGAKGMKVFGVIDQSAEAREAGLELRATTLVLFGNPAAGTPVMAAAPLAALDLPLKVAVWDDDGQTRVSYTAPAELAARYSLSPDLSSRLAGIDALTDALVAN